MSKSRLFQVLTSLVIVAGFVCGQQALAQEKHHWQVKVVPRTTNQQGPHANVTLTPNLYGLWAAFADTSLPTSNTDGSDLWPCFGDTASANPDCPSIGDPTVVFPNGGAVVGGPQYVWSLSACNGTTNGNVLCGQTETFYEDDSGDSSDDLLYSIEVVQGSSVIADSGTIDFGPNPFGGLSPAADVIFSGDQNFGALGETGKNNGNCDASFNYPVTSDPAGVVFGIAANKTCVDPVAGVATLTATTELATPVYKLNTKTGTYTVTFKEKYKVQQKWNINLQ
jgi:hypothetical protein